ncbi:MAG: DUF4276 family protein [Roseiarcus sp.]
MTVRLAISVEGECELLFVNEVLRPRLQALSIYPTPIKLATGRAATGEKAAGGAVNFDRVIAELRRLRADFPDGFVTSLYDFYGFRGRMPGEDVDALEERIAAAVAAEPSNVIPYIQKFEFETLLLSDPRVLADYFGDGAIEKQANAAIRAAGAVEEVNDSPESAPSGRLEAWTKLGRSAYNRRTKTRHAPNLARRIGLAAMRGACPRFDAWLARLEALSAERRR